ncbi:MAG: NAD+ synthase [Desertifilum sp. SIO1I2]|nr:NAD+ synthase [Desertifilum sp. SIO1I2]
MKIAIAQLNPTIGDIAGNTQQILEAAKRAASQGVRLVLTPELSVCGYPPRDLLMAPSFIEAMAIAVAQLAEALPPEVAVLVGTVEPNPDAHQQGDKPLFNSMNLLKGGRVQQVFHKRLLPTYDVFDEDRYFAAGEASHFFTLDGVKVGVTICEDLWNDELFWGKRSYRVNPIADLAQLGVDVVVNLSASPYSVGKQKLREAMLSHGASRYHQPIIYTNQVGGNDDLIFDGCSIAFNRRGELVCRARGFEADEVVLGYDGDLQVLPETTCAALLEVEEAEVWQALVLGVRDYTRKCGFSQVVLGLSGGIDSSLVAAIAAAAIGAENVLGVLMPSPYSSDHSVKDALELAQNLGIRTEIIPIGDLMQGYDLALDKLFVGTSPGIAQENIQSRIRGNLLMAVANQFGHLLISTGNKSEMAVGYCTLYGDMNGGLAAIADVPKTRVYDLCRWLNQYSDREIIPENVLTKPPSAELKPGQVDQDSLPPYEILDDILHRFIHEHQSPQEMVGAGHDLNVVNRVIQLVTRAEFKRRQAPPGLKITQRAFGTGWRMPIASKSLPSLLT